MQTKIFTAHLDQLHEMLGWIRSEAEKAGFDSFDLYKIELAAEEAIVNVIHYSYSDKMGNISIVIALSSQSIQITVSDWGRPFNPLASKSKSHRSDSLEERAMGGLGILFIRKCLDEASYQRKNDQNVFTMIKNRR